jgi:hypothetical protein
MQGICCLAPFDWALKLLKDSVAVFIILLLLATAVFIVALLVGMLIVLREERLRSYEAKKAFLAKKSFLIH